MVFAEMLGRFTKMAENIMVDSHVWVEDPERAWIDGVVLNIKGEEAEIKTNDGRDVKLFFCLLVI